MFERVTDRYIGVSGWLIRKSAFSLVLLLVAAAGAVLVGSRLPSSFLPQEDQGYIYAALQLPDAASSQRTSEAARKVEAILASTPGIQSYATINGFSLLSGVRNTYSAFFFVTLKPWDERKASGQQFDAIVARLNGAFQSVKEGMAFCFPPPAIPGIGASGGFTFILEDRAGRDLSFLSQNPGRPRATSLLDVRQSEQLVYTASAQIPDLERRIEQQENQISLFLGKKPWCGEARPRAHRATAPAGDSRCTTRLAAVGRTNEHGTRCELGYRCQALRDPQQTRPALSAQSDHIVEVVRSRKDGLPLALTSATAPMLPCVAQTLRHVVPEATTQRVQVIRPGRSERRVSRHPDFSPLATA